MKNSKAMLVISAIVLLIGGMSGCASSLIGVTPGAEGVKLADANQVTACQPKGKTIVTVLSKVGFITRGAEDVEANLFQLARNNAVADGADTLVKGDSQIYGKRTFDMYKCRP